MTEAQMISAIREATEAIEKARKELIDLKGQLGVMQLENQRLRARCAKYAILLHKFEDGSL